ncbi:MAG TPA: TIGR02301 family protein [Methylovirgula sp.]|nr:TIGR02301 family protein [Methylovirgula sp.]
MRKALISVAIVSALIAPAAAQNLLERSIAPPQYEEPRHYWREEAPRPKPKPPPAAAALPAQPGAKTPPLPGANPATPANAAEAKPGTPATNAPSEPAPPYEPQLLRLSELLGALTYLQDLCAGQSSGQIWRDKMTALMDAETKDETRKERLAGAYNRGFQGYELNYRQCTPNAQTIITRFLQESSHIARDVTHRYGTS